MQYPQTINTRTSLSPAPHVHYTYLIVTRAQIIARAREREMERDAGNKVPGINPHWKLDLPREERLFFHEKSCRCRCDFNSPQKWVKYISCSLMDTNPRDFVFSPIHGAKYSYSISLCALLLSQQFGLPFELADTDSIGLFETRLHRHLMDGQNGDD